MAKRGKNTYRLQVVLDRREEAKEEAARILAEKREILHQERAKEEQLRKDLLANRDRRRLETDRMMTESMQSGMGVNSAQGRMNFVKRLDVQALKIEEDIRRQKERVARAEREVEEALQDLIQASKELQVMQNHKDRWQKKRRLEEEQTEQREMNEIGNVLYQARRRSEDAAEATRKEQ